MLSWENLDTLIDDVYAAKVTKAGCSVPLSTQQTPGQLSLNCSDRAQFLSFFRGLLCILNCCQIVKA